MPQEEYHDNLCKLLGYLKENFPDQQTVLMTNPHCVIGSSGSVDGYNDVVRSVGRVWSVPVIDLYAESGLLPTVQSHQRFFLDADGTPRKEEGRKKFQPFNLVKAHRVFVPFGATKRERESVLY